MLWDTAGVQPKSVYGAVPHRKSSTAEYLNGRGHNASVVMVVREMRHEVKKILEDKNVEE